jgi:hypothetical protein
MKTTTTWRCLDCDAHGDGDRGAERHVRDHQHGTATTTVPTPEETA